MCDREPIEYFNNKAICDMIDSKRPAGIVALLDEESIRPGEKSDVLWLEKIGKSLGSHKHLKVRQGMADKSIGATEFCIVHYAGDVVYDCTGFLDKNADTLYKDLARVMFKASNTILNECFPGTMALPTYALYGQRMHRSILPSCVLRC
eukprot:m.226161 g.226161  ORF g.226161 m.226161 type:complete len:149 (+) comp19219_c0_seq20:1689-2135(+)